MKKVSTILKQLNKLETELYTNYTEQEIFEGFTKIQCYDPSSILNVIYSGLIDYTETEEEY